MTAPATAPESFTARLLVEVARGAAENHKDNDDIWDGRALGTRSIRERTSQGRPFNAVNPKELPVWAPLFPELDAFCARLDDEASRDLLAKIVAYRLIGRRGIKLPMNNPGFLELDARMTGRARPARLPAGLAKSGVGAGSFSLREIDMRPDGHDVTLLTEPQGAAVEFHLNGYRCPEIGLTVGPGDVAIDAGACWGDTTLHCALDAGATGRVFAFEFEPSNLAVFQASMELNPHLADRVELVRNALWDTSGEEVAFLSNGPGSRLAPRRAEEPRDRVETVTIDDFVQDRRLDRVDFVKMDIEGAEPRALRGARDTIRRFRPGLAVCLYHQPGHYVEIPRIIDEIAPGYRFRIGHYSFSRWETVLHAAPEERST